MSKTAILHYNLVNATLIRETDKAVLIKCEKFVINKEVSCEVWFPKTKCKLIEGVWQVNKKFMGVKAMELGTSIHSVEVWG